MVVLIVIGGCIGRKVGWMSTGALLSSTCHGQRMGRWSRSLSKTTATHYNTLMKEALSSLTSYPQGLYRRQAIPLYHRKWTGGLILWFLCGDGVSSYWGTRRFSAGLKNISNCKQIFISNYNTSWCFKFKNIKLKTIIVFITYGST